MSNSGPWPPPNQDGDPAAGGQYYPSFPASDPYQQAPNVEQPESIRLAVRLMWAGAALSVVSLIVTLATLGSLKSKLRQSLLDSNSSFTSQDFDTLYHATIGVAVVLSLIGVALWLWMAWKNGQGRGWARIVATVLGGLNLLSSLYTLLTGRATTLSELFTLLNLALAVVILFLLWKKESSAYYAATSRRYN